MFVFRFISDCGKFAPREGFRHPFCLSCRREAMEMPNTWSSESPSVTEPFVTSGTSERSGDIKLTGVTPLFDACLAVTLSELTRRVRGGEQQGGDQWLPCFIFLVCFFFCFFGGDYNHCGIHNDGSETVCVCVCVCLWVCVRARQAV